MATIATLVKQRPQHARVSFFVQGRTNATKTGVESGGGMEAFVPRRHYYIDYVG